MSFHAFTETVRGVLSDEESRWWRINILAGVTLALCVAMATASIHSGHSYAGLLVPISYVGIWKSLSRCRQFLGSMTAGRNASALRKLSSELQSLALSLNLTILLIGIFCVWKP